MDERTQKRIEELKKQQQKIAAEISQLKSHRNLAIKDIISKMVKNDITLDDLKEELGVRKKYLNPETGESWSGKGRKPFWVENAIRTGKSLEDFLV